MNLFFRSFSDPILDKDARSFRFWAKSSFSLNLDSHLPVIRFNVPVVFGSVSGFLFGDSFSTGSNRDSKGAIFDKDSRVFDSVIFGFSESLVSHCSFMTFALKISDFSLAIGVAKISDSLISERFSFSSDFGVKKIVSFGSSVSESIVESSISGFGIVSGSEDFSGNGVSATIEMTSAFELTSGFEITSAFEITSGFEHTLAAQNSV